MFLKTSLVILKGGGGPFQARNNECVAFRKLSWITLVTLERKVTLMLLQTTNFAIIVGMPEMKFFKFYEKSICGVYFVFLYQVPATSILKTNFGYFFGKNLFLWFLSEMVGVSLVVREQQISLAQKKIWLC